MQIHIQQIYVDQLMILENHVYFFLVWCYYKAHEERKTSELRMDRIVVAQLYQLCLDEKSDNIQYNTIHYSPIIT